MAEEHPAPADPGDAEAAERDEADGAVVTSLQAQLELAQWEIDSRDATIEAMSRQLRGAEQRLRAIGPLESSAKLQLLALRRTLPLAVRTRLATFRSRYAARRRGRTASDKEEDSGAAIDSAAFLRDSPATLAELLARAVPDRYGHDPAGVQRDLFDGVPLTAAHREGLAATRHHPPVASEGAAELLATLHGRGAATEGSIEQLVHAADPELVSFDIWDTLLIRNRPADASKTATARRMLLNPARLPRVRGRDPFEIAQVRVDVELDLARAHPREEYELTDVLIRTLERLGHAPGAACREYARELAEAEIADEVAWSWVRQEVLHVAQVHGQRAVLASDFYMTGEDLQRIVAEVTGADLPTVVSIDRGLSKRLEGELLEAIRRERGVSALGHLHLGDNLHSDIQNQVATGGLAIHIPRWSPFPDPGSFRSDDLASCWAELDRQLAIFDAEHPTDSLARLAGREAAVFAVALVARAMEEAWQRAGDRVHYVSREGIFLAQVHERIEHLLRPPGGAPVRAVHLALSRRATFGASLEEPVLESLQRMWSMYREQSVSAMLISIGLEPAAMSGALARHGLAPETRVKDPTHDSRIRSFFADPDVQRTLTRHIDSARRLLRAYVMGRTKLEPPFIVVDIGWRGTIQDNLVRALDVQRSLGVYFGLFPYLNEQPLGCTKVAVALDGNAGDEYTFVHPPAALERPWTPDVPSTIGFAEDAEGNVVPVHAKEGGAVSEGIGDFQEGTLEVADIVARWMVGMGLTSSVIGPDLQRLARSYWNDPPPGVADMWFDSAHDDSFGALNEVSFGKMAPDRTWLDGPLREHLAAGERSSEWAAGYRQWRPVRSVIALARTTLEAPGDGPSA